jgi:hypothetical protein
MVVRALRPLAFALLLWGAWWFVMTRERVAAVTVDFALRHRLEWLLMAAQLGGAEVDRQTWPYVPAFYLAVGDGDPETMRLLLRHGAKPRLEVQDEYTFARHENLRLCGAPCARVLADFGYATDGAQGTKAYTPVLPAT